MDRWSRCHGAGAADGSWPRSAALVATVLFAGAAATARRVRLPRPRRSAGDSVDEPKLADTLLAGIRVVVGDPRARVPMMMAVLDNFLYGYLIVALLLLARQVLGGGAAATGWLNAAFAAGAFTAGHDQPHRGSSPTATGTAGVDAGLCRQRRRPEPDRPTAGGRRPGADRGSRHAGGRGAVGDVVTAGGTGGGDGTGVRHLRPDQRRRGRARFGAGRTAGTAVGTGHLGGCGQFRSARRLGRRGDPDALTELGRSPCQAPPTPS